MRNFKSSAERMHILRQVSAVVCVSGYIRRRLLEKGGLLFAQAAVLAQARLPGWRFVMIGAWVFCNEAPNSYEKEIIAEMQKLGVDGEMTGYLPRQTVLERLAGTAVAVVPSLWEDPCPLTVIEAMSSGCAVIATRHGGIPELTGDAGLLVEQDNAELLAECMVQVARDDQALANWQAQARDRAVQALDIRYASERLDGIRQRLIDAPQASSVW